MPEEITCTVWMLIHFLFVKLDYFVIGNSTSIFILTYLIAFIRSDLKNKRFSSK